jgi:hypothetical protein
VSVPLLLLLLLLAAPGLVLMMSLLALPCMSQLHGTQQPDQCVL